MADDALWEPARRNHKIRRGDTWEWAIDWDDGHVPANWPINYVFRLQARSNEGGALLFENIAALSATKPHITFKQNPADTKNFVPGDYVYDAELTNTNVSPEENNTYFEGALVVIADVSVSA